MSVCVYFPIHFTMYVYKYPLARSSNATFQSDTFNAKLTEMPVGVHTEKHSLKIQMSPLCKNSFSVG